MPKDPYTFQCKLCGNCCRGKGYVYLKPSEIRRMAEFLNLNFLDFEILYVTTYDGRKILNSKWNEDCIFLEDGLCKVHAVKPDQCRKWPFWKELFESDKAFLQAKSYCEGLKEFEFEDFFSVLKKKNP